jgi:hypothetical protein
VGNQALPPLVRQASFHPYFLPIFRGRLQDLLNSTSKFSSILVMALKLVFCSSRDDDPLDFEKKSFH